MTKKKGLGYYLKVGFHLFLIGILASIIVAVVMIPLSLLLGLAAVFSIGMLAAGGALGIIQLFLSFLLMGYFVVRWKGWVFADKIL